MRKATFDDLLKEQKKQAKILEEINKRVKLLKPTKICSIDVDLNNLLKVMEKNSRMDRY